MIHSPTKALRRVALICMPFFEHRSPSLAMGTLAETLRSAGHFVNVHYFNLEAAARLGPATYAELQSFGSWQLQLGEWLLASEQITPGAASAEEYAAFIASERSPVRRARGELFPVLAADGGVISPATLTRLRGPLREMIEDWGETIDRGQYDIIGFTVGFQQLNASLQLAKKIKDRHPQNKIILGGSGLRGPMGEAVFRRYRWVDAVFDGYAEATLLSYLTECTEIERAHISDAGQPIQMDELPIPRFDDFFEQIQALEYARPEELLIPAEATRGCYWARNRQCYFCGRPQGQYHQKSADRVFQELQSLKRYGTPIRLVDDTLPPVYLRKVFPRLASGGARLEHGLILFANSRMEEHDLRILADAGVTLIIAGIESLSTPILESMGKHVRAVDNIWLLRAAEEQGIHVGWDFLVNMPNEPPGEIDGISRLIPALSHLPSPVRLNQVEVHRFSPMAQDPERFGLTRIQPAAPYALAFGDHPDLADQAFRFDFDRKQSGNPNGAEAVFSECVRRWRVRKELPLAPRCEVFEVLGRFVLVDTRPWDGTRSWMDRVRVLTPRDVLLLKALSFPISAAALASRCGIAWEEIREDVEGLIRREYVVSRDEQMVRVVVMRRRPYLGSEVSRVLRLKCQQLRHRSWRTEGARNLIRDELRRLPGLLARAPREERLKDPTGERMIGLHTLLRALERVLFTALPRGRANAVEEHILSLIPGLRLQYERSRECVIAEELRHLRTLDLDGYRQVIVVGSGAIPFSGIALAHHFCKPILLLDRSRLACWSARRLLATRGTGGESVCKVNGEDFEGYQDCIVLISHYTDNKARILDKIQRDGGGRRMVLLRLHRGEQLVRTGWEETTVSLSYPGLELLVLSTGEPDPSSLTSSQDQR